MLRNNDAAFVIYCDNEDAYVYTGDTLISMRTLSIETEVASNPILIFSENDVWYPLMGRDDRERSNALQKLVRLYSTNTTTPSLTSQEIEITTSLQYATRLTHEQESLATLSAAKLSIFYGFYIDQHTNSELYELWAHHFPGFDEEVLSCIHPHPSGGLDDVILSQIVMEANRLSPFAADLSARMQTGRDAVNTAYAEYFDWNIIWPLGMVQMTAEESYASKGGDCIDLANIWMAVYNLAGISAVSLHWYNGRKTHVIVYATTRDEIASNKRIGALQAIESSIMAPVFKITTTDGWAIPMRGIFIGTLPLDDILGLLAKLQKIREIDLVGLSVNSFGNVSFLKFEKLLMYFQHEGRDTFHTLVLP